jgi:hypothetical protein
MLWLCDMYVYVNFSIVEEESALKIRPL